MKGKLVRTGIFLAGLLAALAVFSATTRDLKIDTVTYWINSYRVPCTGVAPMNCLQIRNESSKQWQNFYSSIKGFDYQPGYLYRVLVREEQLDPSQVPADASSIRYTLVSVEEKIRDPKLRINDIWVLREMAGREILEEELSGRLKRPYIEFQLRDSRYMGTDGSNDFRGSIEFIGDSELRLGPALSTKMHCRDMTIPDAFHALISRVDAYELKDGNLALLEGDTILLNFRKTD